MREMREMREMRGDEGDEGDEGDGEMRGDEGQPPNSLGLPSACRERPLCLRHGTGRTWFQAPCQSRFEFPDEPCVGEGHARACSSTQLSVSPAHRF